MLCGYMKAVKLYHLCVLVPYLLVGSSNMPLDNVTTDAPAHNPLMLVEINDNERAVELICQRRLRPPVPSQLPDG